MSKIVKEKNIIKFYLGNDDRHYDFDINSGVLYGLKGSPLKRSPSGFVAFMSSNQNESNVLSVLHYFHSWNGRGYTEMNGACKYIQICDKLDSIGYKCPNYARWSLDALNFVDKNFKTFVKYMKEKSEDYTISDFFKDYSMQIWLEENNLKLDEHFTETMAKMVARQSNWDKKKIGCAIFYLKRGLHKVLRSEYTTMDLLNQYFNFCDRIEKEYVRGDFIREYVIAKETYELKKTELDNNALYKNQMARIKSLAFENEEFKVIVPFTTKEFLEEAERQGNCVARSYLHRVVDGLTNIVFIRKKSDIEKSYITCEVNGRDIVQYLGKYNSHIRDASAIEFKKAYQMHLNNTWE